MWLPVVYYKMSITWYIENLQVENLITFTLHNIRIPQYVQRRDVCVIKIMLMCTVMDLSLSLWCLALVSPTRSFGSTSSSSVTLSYFRGHLFGTACTCTCNTVTTFKCTNIFIYYTCTYTHVYTCTLLYRNMSPNINDKQQAHAGMIGPGMG